MSKNNIFQKILRYPISMTVFKACKVLNISDAWIPKKLRTRTTLNREKILKKANNRIFSIINIPTYDGFNQTVHPDVVKIKNKGKDYYLMAITPYPYGYDKYENPCVYISYDGFKWSQVADKPLFYPSKGKGNHLSDPELLVNKGKIVLYFRECTFGEQKFDIIYKSESENLEVWSEPQKLITVNSDEGIISPAIIKYNDLFIKFNVSKKKGLLRNEDKEGTYETSFYECNVKNEPKNRIIWHIDIKKIDVGCLVGLFVYATKLGGRKTRLYYAESYDLGHNWNILGEIKLCDNQDEIIDSVYRATFVENIKSEGYNIYVSLMTKEYSWHTVLIEQFNKDSLNLDYDRKE